MKVSLNRQTLSETSSSKRVCEKVCFAIMSNKCESIQIEVHLAYIQSFGTARNLKPTF